ncbi:hypothetical protein KSF78_0002526 [Schistosoma japonicum]|nr:hypothetical protein KSF78_0002526 [Schistosoma japonicum]
MQINVSTTSSSSSTTTTTTSTTTTINNNSNHNNNNFVGPFHDHFSQIFELAWNEKSDSPDVKKKKHSLNLNIVNNFLLSCMHSELECFNFASE